MTIFDRWLQGAPPPVAKLLNIELTAMTPGTATVCMQTQIQQQANPMGTLHGGILCDLADAAMGTAWASELTDAQTFTTVELKINYFRPVWSETLTAQARVIRRGRSMGYIECDIHDSQQRLVARAASTCMTLEGDRASGR